MTLTQNIVIHERKNLFTYMFVYIMKNSSLEHLKRIILKLIMNVK